MFVYEEFNEILYFRLTIRRQTLDEFFQRFFSDHSELLLHCLYACKF